MKSRRICDPNTEKKTIKQRHLDWLSVSFNYNRFVVSNKHWWYFCPHQTCFQCCIPNTSTCITPYSTTPRAHIVVQLYPRTLCIGLISVINFSIILGCDRNWQPQQPCNNESGTNNNFDVHSGKIRWFN